MRLVSPPLVLASCGLYYLLSAPSSLSQTTTPPLATDAKPSHWLLAPSLRVEKTDLVQAKFPVVDAHTHFLFKARHDKELLHRFVQAMDRNNIAVCASLDGVLGPKLADHKDFLWSEYKDRFVIFATIDFQGSAKPTDFAKWECNQPHFIRHTVELLRESHRQGTISGLKLFKDFGLRYRDAAGSLLTIDDPRWDPIWECCGELGIPIIMHTADPSAFFRPIDENNERLRELTAHPDWSFVDEKFPSRDSLLAARNRVIDRFPNTNFIAAHFANDAEDLAQLSDWLDLYPNLHIEFASRINELGRQPYSSRDFFLKHQDRILFGTDGPWPEERLRLYWRFLETRDEYFPYSDKVPPPQGDWNIYGIHLDDDVLKKIYQANSAKLIPGVDERLKRYHQLP